MFQMPNEHADLWSAVDYRSFLRRWFEREKERRPALSFRYMGRRLSMDPSLLAKIFLGERHLATSRIQPMCDLVGLSGREAEYFRHLVLHAKSKTAREAQACQERLHALRRISPVAVDTDAEPYWEKWQHVALRELLSCGDFDDDWERLGRMLRPRQRGRNVREAMRRLEALGMVHKGDDGFWRSSDAFLRSPPAPGTGALRAFHRQSTLLARAPSDGEEPLLPHRLGARGRVLPHRGDRPGVPRPGAVGRGGHAVAVARAPGERSDLPPVPARPWRMGRTMKLLFLWIPLLALLLAAIGCGDTQSSGGTSGTETDNALVIRPFHTIIATTPPPVVARVWPEGQIPDTVGTPPAFEAVSDPDGLVRLRLPKGRWSLLVVSRGFGFRRTIDGDTAIYDTLMPMTFIEGNVVDAPGAWLLLPGLGRALRCGAKGQFRVDSLVPGALPIAVRQAERLGRGDVWAGAMLNMGGLRIVLDSLDGGWVGPEQTP